MLQIGNGTLHCQLDTGAYASVIKTMQLRQVAPNAKIKPTKKTLVSYSQHRITPMGYITLPVRFKDRRLNVNFYVIDSKQKPILSGKGCQALNFVQQVHNILHKRTTGPASGSAECIRSHAGNLFHKD